MRRYKENGIKNVNEEYIILFIQRIIVLAFLIVIGNYKGKLSFQYKTIYDCHSEIILK